MTLPPPAHKRLSLRLSRSAGEDSDGVARVRVRSRLRFLFRSFFCGALLQAITGACLLPPPVSIEQGVNGRPFVLTEQVKPPQASVELNLNCQTCKFTIQADDPDAGDTIHSRWFWDYDQGDPNTAIRSQSEMPPATGVLRVPNDYTFDPRLVFSSEAFINTTHTLEVVLSDRQFLPDQATPINRAPPEGAGITSYRWTVKLVRRGTRCDDVQNICTSEITQ